MRTLRWLFAALAAAWVPTQAAVAQPTSLLWFNSQAGGVVLYWQMSGTTVVSTPQLSSTVGATSGWQLVGAANPSLSGSFTPDLLWFNTQTGETFYWQMNGTVIVTGASFGSVPPATGWQLIGSASPSFSGSATPDLLWYNQFYGWAYYWEMDGTTVVGGGTLAYRGPNTGWLLAGAVSPSFSGSATPDLLWYNAQTGEVDYWKMNGTAVVKSGFIADIGANSGWNVVGIVSPSISGSASPDLLWFNAAFGAVDYWTMSGTTWTGGNYLASLPPTSGWQLVGVNNR